MTCKVQDIYNILDRLAPFENAEDWDNVGLIVGNKNNIVKGVLVALDCTLEVIEEALDLDANLILTHHPLMFRATQKLDVSGGEGLIISQLCKYDLNLIAAHTNADISPVGINKTLGELLELSNLEQDSFVFTGNLPQILTGEQFQNFASKKLNWDIRMYGDKSTDISRISVSGGAGGEFWTQAINSNSQAFLTGELKHHEILEALAEGLVLFEAGHYSTEAPGIMKFGQCLQKDLDSLQCGVVVQYSSLHPYRS